MVGQVCLAFMEEAIDPGYCVVGSMSHENQWRGGG